jgi:hypothetical protein
MSTIETHAIDDLAYEIEYLSTASGFKAACGCPKCPWAFGSEVHRSQHEAIDAVTAAIRQHHASHHQHAMV